MDKKSIVVLSCLGIFVISIGIYNFLEIMPNSVDMDRKGQIQTEMVCMVNDAYMGKEQIPVPVEDQIYYGCCQMCVTKLQNQREVRFAIDPFSGKEVDKAKAFIVLKSNGTDAVWYFKSADNYKKFLARKDQ